MNDNDALMLEENLEDWVMDKAESWRNHYTQNYKEKHDEYYRLWRGIWANEDKTRSSERSKIISPALQQAVESSVAEIEEATFGRGKWFDIEDNIGDSENQDVKFLRNKLQEDFKFGKVRKAISECVLNAAIFGTGIAEVVMEQEKESTPATQDVMDGQMKAVGVNIQDRTVIKLKPVLPKNFFIDPIAGSIDDALGCGTDEFVSKHSVELLQEQGVYTKVDIETASEEIGLEADETLAVFNDNKTRLTKYHGFVPTDLLKKTGETIPEGHDSSYIKAIVVIANGGTLLKATANPFMMQDSSMISFSWDIVPSRFWGRGVCEKGFNSQKALDAELRARIDALALTVHPMLAMDATRIPRGTKPEVRPGKILLTNGSPAEILQPFNFGNVSQITFAQASALQQMVQQSTGAVDSTGTTGAINGEATAAGISMSLGAIIKRHKRTLINFQENFLIPFVTKAAHRYMQFEPEMYPVKDYKFNASSSLGIMAREYEVTQLVQLLQTMGQDSPVYLTLVQSVIENMNLGNREELVQQVMKAGQPNPEQQKEQQAQLQAQIEFQKAQTSTVAAQGQEAQAKAHKTAVEAKLLPDELELDKLRVAAINLKDGENDDIEFDRRMRIAELHLKEKAIDRKNEQKQSQMEQKQAQAAQKQAQMVQKQAQAEQQQSQVAQQQEAQMAQEKQMMEAFNV